MNTPPAMAEGFAHSGLHTNRCKIGKQRGEVAVCKMVGFSVLEVTSTRAFGALQYRERGIEVARPPGNNIGVACKLVTIVNAGGASGKYHVG